MQLPRTVWVAFSTDVMIMCKVAAILSWVWPLLERHGRTKLSSNSGRCVHGLEYSHCVPVSACGFSALGY